LLAGVGAIFAGVTASIQRKKIVDGYWAEIKKGRAQMETALNEKLSVYVETIKNRISENFSNLDAMLANEETQLKAIDTRFNTIENRFKTLDADLIID
jgi:archaellum component FlaC